MRDWLWKYGPRVIFCQLALKRDLKARGYYPNPLSDAFVREVTEQTLLLSGAGSFRRNMNKTGGAIDAAIQHRIPNQSFPLHVLLIKYGIQLLEPPV